MNREVSAIAMGCDFQLDELDRERLRAGVREQNGGEPPDLRLEPASGRAHVDQRAGFPPRQIDSAGRWCQREKWPIGNRSVIQLLFLGRLEHVLILAVWRQWRRDGDGHCGRALQTSSGIMRKLRQTSLPRICFALTGPSSVRRQGV